MVRSRAIFALGLCFAAACATATDASACRGPTWERSLFFDEVPASINAPAIADVIVVRVRPGPEPYTQVAIASVSKVIKGELDPKLPLHIVFMPSSCGPYLQAGDRGIVIGEVRPGNDGTLELRPFSESYGERENRKNAMREKSS